MKTVRITVHFPRGYIADPYWPEQARLIDIIKESGMSRARSDAARDKALRDYLNKHHMTLEDFRAIEAAAQRPFYRLDGPGSPIIIPEHQVYGCLVNAAATASSSVRIAQPDQVRSLLICSHWETPMTEASGTFDRFVRPMSSGKALSNQRTLRSNPYIAGFQATGTIAFDPDLVQERRLTDFLAYAGREVGVGASRKLGWGRFTLEDIRVV